MQVVPECIGWPAIVAASNLVALQKGDQGALQPRQVATAEQVRFRFMLELLQVVAARAMRQAGTPGGFTGMSRM